MRQYKCGQHISYVLIHYPEKQISYATALKLTSQTTQYGQCKDFEREGEYVAIIKISRKRHHISLTFNSLFPAHYYS